MDFLFFSVAIQRLSSPQKLPGAQAPHPSVEFLWALSRYTPQVQGMPAFQITTVHLLAVTSLNSSHHLVFLSYEELRDGCNQDLVTAIM